MKSVNIFQGRYGLDNLLRIQVRRQGHLNQDARDLRVVIEVSDKLQNLILRCVRREFVVKGCDTALLAIAKLRAHVGRRGLIVADENHGKAGIHPCALKRRNILGGLRTHLGGKPLSINNGGHDLCSLQQRIVYV